MTHDLRIIDGASDGREAEKSDLGQVSSEVLLQHFRNVTASMTTDALRIWVDLYSEFEGNVTYGTMITADLKNGFHPSCGWPEFLEKMRLLEYYLNHLKRIADGRS